MQRQQKDTPTNTHQKRREKYSKLIKREERNTPNSSKEKREKKT